MDIYIKHTYTHTHKHTQSHNIITHTTHNTTMTINPTISNTHLPLRVLRIEQIYQEFKILENYYSLINKMKKPTTKKLYKMYGEYNVIKNR